MEILLTIIGIIGFCTIIVVPLSILICAISDIGVYGKPISKEKEKEEKIIKHLPEYSLNPYSTRLLTTYGRLPYIASVSSILFKYHVQGVGLIWKYSSLSKAVEQRFVQLNFNEKFK
jgi:hypothetical protein